MNGIKIYINPHNDPRWSDRTGVYEEYPPEIIRAYSLGNKGKKSFVSFSKPDKNLCRSVVCFDKVPFGVMAYKIENWEELPDELPYNEGIINSYFFDGYDVIVKK